MYARVLEAVMENDQLTVADLPLLTPEEERELNAAGTSPRQKKETSGSIPEWFDQQADSNPDAEAMVFGEGRISWKDLQSKSRRYAVALNKLGVRSGSTVALRLEASANAAAAALALLRLGAIVVPVPIGTAQTGIDQIENELKPEMILISEGASRSRELLAARSVPSHLGERRDYASADADQAMDQAASGTTASGNANRTSAGNGPDAGVANAAPSVSTSSTDPADPSTEAEASGNQTPTHVVTLHDVEFLSCAILPLTRFPYPVGQQTAWLGLRSQDGQLKTSAASHESTLAGMMATAQAMNLRRGDTLLVFPAPSSATAWTDLMLPLLAGARIVHTRETFPTGFNELVDSERASFAFATPSEWLSLMHAGWSGHPRLQKVTRGTYASPAALRTIAEGFPAAWFLAVSPILPGPFSVETLTAADHDGAPLSPLPGDRLLLTDEVGHPVPFLVNGDLRVERKGQVYPTGSIGTYSPETGFRLVDSADRLVKLRGFRLWLRDIEDLLAEHPQVAAAEATLLQKEDGTEALVAYVGSYEGLALPLHDISSFLKARAPAHLAGTEIIPVPALVRRIDGSVDASYQRRLEPGQIVTPTGKAEFIGPRDELEEKLVDIWETVLGVEGIGVKTSFFSLGGYSLMIVRLFARINKSMGTSLPITTIFNAPTIEQLADILRGRTIYSSLVPIQVKGTKPPFFLVHSYLLYDGLRSVLGEDQPFYGLRELDRDADMTLDIRVESYAKEIRRIQPHGPYYIGGWCAAGPLAVSTARKLTDAGEKVDLLVLFDSWRPGYAAEVANTHSANPEMSLSSRLRRKWRFHQMKLGRMSLGQKIQYFGDATLHKLRSMRDHFYIRNWGLAQQLFTRFNLPLPDFMHNVSLTTMHAVKLYRGTPFPGRITLIRATEAHYIPGADISCGWGALAREGVRVLWAPGDHESMFVDPNLDVLGTLLKGVLSDPFSNE
jgi:thioesterase domain-containing protein/acyl-CoA synthetase (AMP-forming)/AMP-acid ligase II/acyl carrier protein